MEENTRAILTVYANEPILFWKKMAPTLLLWQDDPIPENISYMSDRSFKPFVICQSQGRGHLLNLNT